MEASSNCPICGFDRPHQHTSLEVAHHQGAIERKDPISFESYGMAFREAVKGKLETGGWPTMASLIRNRAQEIQFRMNRSPKAALPVAVGAGEDAKLLDSGMIVIVGRDEFGEATRCLHTGMNIRAQIQEAIDYQAAMTPATPAGKVGES